jgi:hypothetical protein
MGLDLAELKFCGLANTVALEEFAGSFDDARSTALQESLYREWVAAGSAKNARDWLRPRIAALFACAGERPKWIERTPQWPFLNGRPMMFLVQFDVPATDQTTAHLATDIVIYVFGAKVPHPEITDGWTLEYKVVTQHRSLP